MDSFAFAEIEYTSNSMRVPISFFFLWRKLLPIIIIKMFFVNYILFYININIYELFHASFAEVSRISRQSISLRLRSRKRSDISSPFFTWTNLKSQKKFKKGDGNSNNCSSQQCMFSSPEHQYMQQTGQYDPRNASLYLF